MKGQELFTQVTGRDADNWAHLTDTSRASWDQRAAGTNAFVPSTHVNHVEEAPAEKVAVPEPEVRARPIGSYPIPAGAKTVINRLKRHGWSTEVLHARGPWVKHDGEPDMYHPFAAPMLGGPCERVEIVAQTTSILVRGRRGDRKVAAIWVLRPGLKDASFKLHFIYTVPTPEGQFTGRIDSKQLKAITESEPET